MSGSLMEEAIVESEFASVSVRIDRDANGPRLRIEDRRTGRVAHLDPLELETLAWLPEEVLQRWLDPSAHRWRSEERVTEADRPPPT